MSIYVWKSVKPDILTHLKKSLKKINKANSKENLTVKNHNGRLI